MLLFRNGKVDRFDVEQAIEVDGKRCSGKGNYLHQSGKLKRCVLAEAATIDDTEHEAGAAVCFDQAGKSSDCKGLRLRKNG